MHVYACGGNEDNISGVDLYQRKTRAFGKENQLSQLILPLRLESL